MLEEILDLRETYEETENRLAQIERELADRFCLRGPVRKQLLVMDRKGELIEDELVADWHETYSSLLDWMENQSMGPPPKQRTMSTPEAATAASAVL